VSNRLFIYTLARKCRNHMSHLCHTVADHAIFPKTECRNLAKTYTYNCALEHKLLLHACNDHQCCDHDTMNVQLKTQLQSLKINDTIYVTNVFANMRYICIENHAIFPKTECRSIAKTHVHVRYQQNCPCTHEKSPKLCDTMHVASKIIQKLPCQCS
jgi:hypothetical protein